MSFRPLSYEPELASGFFIQSIRFVLWVSMALMFSAVLIGCSPASPLTVSRDLLELAWDPSRSVKKGSLNPNFRYIRVQLDRVSSVLALAYVEELPHLHESALEVYVTANRETLSLRGGKVERFTSSERSFFRGGAASVVQPGYSVSNFSTPSLEDDLSNRSVLPPAEVRKKVFNPQALPLSWQKIPSGWSAFVNSENQVGGGWFFTYQCLDEDLCLSIQPWSIDLQREWAAS